MKRITINKAISRYRESFFLTPIKDDISQDVFVDENEIDSSLDHMLLLIQELPHQYRLVFNLYVMDDYSHKEIAEMLNINIGTSKSNLARAKGILKEKIELNNNYSIKKTK